MNIDLLLRHLKPVKQISITETRSLKDGCTVYTISTVLPEFPFGKDKHAWYTLVVEDGQTEIPKSEINAMLRHLWHLGLDLNEPPPPPLTSTGSDSN